MRQSDRAREPTIRDVPGDHPGCRIIGEFNLSRAVRRYWRHALLAGQRKLEGVGPRQPGPGDSDQGGGNNEDSPRDCGTHDRPPTVPTTTKRRRSYYMPISCHFKVDPAERPLLVGERHGIKLEAPDRRTPAGATWLSESLLVAGVPRIRRGVRAACHVAAGANANLA